MKIIEIKGCKHCKQVLLFIDRNSNGEDFVKIVAWHQDKDGADLIQTAEVDYNETEDVMLMHQRFIADFSEVTANEFANSFSF